MKIQPNMKVRGSIIHGNGLNKKAWVEKARKEGFVPRDKGKYTELWK